MSVATWRGGDGRARARGERPQVSVVRARGGTRARERRETSSSAALRLRCTPRRLASGASTGADDESTGDGAARPDAAGPGVGLDALLLDRLGSGSCARATPACVSSGIRLTEKPSCAMSRWVTLRKKRPFGSAPCVPASQHTPQCAGPSKASPMSTTIDTPQNRALLKAATEGDTRAVQYLLKAGADPNALDVHSEGPMQGQANPPLYYAVKAGHAATVEVLIAGGAYLEPVCGHHGGTPLFAAARLGQLECVRVLVNAGANKDFVATGHYKGKPIDVVCDSSDAHQGEENRQLIKAALADTADERRAAEAAAAAAAAAH